MKTLRVVLVILNIMLLLFIWGNSARPADESSRQSGGLSVLLEETLAKFNIVLEEGQAQHIIRKTAHFIEFAALGFLLSAAFSAFGKKLRVYGAHVLLGSGMTAVVDEYIQLHFPGRSGEVTDVILDFSGALAGLLFMVLLMSLYQYRKKKQADT